MLDEYIKDRSGGKNPCLANAISYITGIPRDGIPNFIQHEDFWASVDAYLYDWGSHWLIYEDDKLAYDSYPKGGALETTDMFVILPCYSHPRHDTEEISDGC